VTPHDQDATGSAPRQNPSGTVDVHARRSIERLRHDLRQLDQANQDMRRDIELLIASIESHLDLPGQPPAPTALLESVKAKIRQFEVEHPRLIASLEQLLGTLSSSGI
jgi:hypothetical protein